jgi:hypothetical protein
VPAPNAIPARAALLAAFSIVAVLLLGLGAPSADAKKPVRATSLGQVKMRTYVTRPASSRSSLAIVSQAPANGSVLAGRISWQVSTSGSRVYRVDFSVDGSVKSSDPSSPFSYAAGLDTAKLANGVHRLTATAYAPGTKPASATVQVTVGNPSAAATAAPAASAAPAPSSMPESTPVPIPTAERFPVAAPGSPTSAPDPTPTPESTPESSPAPSSSKIYWGAWIGDQLTGGQAPWDMGAVNKLEEMSKKKLSIVNFSAPFANCSGSSCSYYNFPAGEFNNIRSHGSIPFYSWGSQSIPVPANLSEPNFALSKVIAGNFDTYIRKFAEAAKAWGHPFFLRFNWEMNGGWFSWSEGVNGNKSGEYVAAWRHVHDIFTQVGATNATWVWCPNVDPEGQMQNLANLYPGDAYVDWTGLDGYNWGTNPAHSDRWRSFDQLYRSTYAKITEAIAPSKPMIVSEVGSTEYGGSKASWISDMLKTIPAKYPKIRGLLWFENYADGMDWPLETSQSATNAFAEGIQSSAYMGNEFGSLPFSAVQTPS